MLCRMGLGSIEETRHFRGENRMPVWRGAVALVGSLYFSLRWEVLAGIIKVSSAKKVTGLSSFWCCCVRGHR